MKIIFMGTPHFACETLENLIKDDYFEILAVYTKEPQIAGRGHKLTNSPIHDLALKHGLKVITPKSLKNLEVQTEFKSFNADAAIVLAYGLILPQEILNSTKFGCINIHPSLLPKWRGPSPIQYSLLAGDEETGVTIMKMDAGIDSGDIMAQEKFTLNNDDNYENLSKKLSTLGSKILIETLKKLEKNEVNFIKQDNALASFSKKILKEDYKINWNLLAQEIERKIRALNGVYFEYNGEKIKIYKAEIVQENSINKKIGEIVNEKFVIQCKNFQIKPLILQKQGGKAIYVDDFLRGFKLK